MYSAEQKGTLLSNSLAYHSIQEHSNMHPGSEQLMQHGSDQKMHPGSEQRKQSGSDLEMQRGWDQRMQLGSDRRMQITGKDQSRQSLEDGLKDADWLQSQLESISSDIPSQQAERSHHKNILTPTELTRREMENQSGSKKNALKTANDNLSDDDSAVENFWTKYIGNLKGYLEEPNTSNSTEGDKRLLVSPPLLSKYTGPSRPAVNQSRGLPVSSEHKTSKYMNQSSSSVPRQTAHDVSRSFASHYDDDDNSTRMSLGHSREQNRSAINELSKSDTTAERGSSAVGGLPNRPPVIDSGESPRYDDNIVKVRKSVYTVEEKYISTGPSFNIPKEPVEHRLIQWDEPLKKTKSARYRRSRQHLKDSAINVRVHSTTKCSSRDERDLMPGYSDQEKYLSVSRDKPERRFNEEPGRRPVLESKTRTEEEQERWTGDESIRKNGGNSIGMFDEKFDRTNDELGERMSIKEHSKAPEILREVIKEEHSRPALGESGRRTSDQPSNRGAEKHCNRRSEDEPYRRNVEERADQEFKLRAMHHLEELIRNPIIASSLKAKNQKDKSRSDEIRNIGTMGRTEQKDFPLDMDHRHDLKQSTVRLVKRVDEERDSGQSNSDRYAIQSSSDPRSFNRDELRNERFKNNLQSVDVERLSDHRERSMSLSSELSNPFIYVASPPREIRFQSIDRSIEHISSKLGKRKSDLVHNLDQQYQKRVEKELKEESSNARYDSYQILQCTNQSQNLDKLSKPVRDVQGQKIERNVNCAENTSRGRLKFVGQDRNAAPIDRSIAIEIGPLSKERDSQNSSNSRVDNLVKDNVRETIARNSVSELCKQLPPDFLEKIISGHIPADVLEKIAHKIPAEVLQEAVNSLKKESGKRAAAAQNKVNISKQDSSNPDMLGSTRNKTIESQVSRDPQFTGLFKEQQIGDTKQWMKNREGHTSVKGPFSTEDGDVDTGRNKYWVTAKGADSIPMNPLVELSSKLPSETMALLITGTMSVQQVHELANIVPSELILKTMEFIQKNPSNIVSQITTKTMAKREENASQVSLSKHARKSMDEPLLKSESTASSRRAVETPSISSRLMKLSSKSVAVMAEEEQTNIVNSNEVPYTYISSHKYLFTQTYTEGDICLLFVSLSLAYT